MSHDKIGRFFASQKQDTAVAAIEDHLLKFWDPRMRRAILAQLADGSIELDPPVRQAVEQMGRRTPA
jgi:formate dehydrogenase subunit delta